MLAGVAVGLLAVNLRTFVGSLGVTLPDVRDSLAINTTVAGLLTTFPVLAFALAGPLAPRLVARVGLRGAATVTLAVLAFALVARSLADASWWFVAITALAPAGVAIGNVILPALVKQHFPGRIALASSVGTALVVLGGAVSAAVTVPIANAFGGWRSGLGVWGVLAGLAVLPWVLQGREAGTASTTPGGSAAASPLRWQTVARSPVAWALVAVFAVQAMGAYVGFGWLAEVYQSAGVDANEAGLLVGVWNLLGVPAGLLVPILLRRNPSAVWVPWLWALATAAGWLGLVLVSGPGPAVWFWTVVLGVGGGSFPWVLAMVALHSRSVADTALLSGFVQSIGYLLAAAGPFGFGALHDLTGSWRPSLIAIAVISLAIGVAGTVVVRSRPYGS